jgi:6-phosphofructokinase 1
MIPNPLVPFIGKARDANSHVMVSGLLSGPNTAAVKLTLPEAGPRETLCYPTNAAKKFRVAIMVVGGIAPGINAVIDGIVQRHWLYAEKGNCDDKLEIWGLINGVDAFKDLNDSYRLLVSGSQRVDNTQLRLDSSRHAHDGGSILGTCRNNELIREPERSSRLKNIVRQLEPYDILYVIGGDGGMRLAHAIRNYAIAEGREGVRELSVIGIPKTMDNDILGCGRRSASCLPWTRPEKLLNISTLR